MDSTAREIGEKSLLSRFAAVYKRKYDWDMSDSKEPIYEVRPHPVSWPARDSSRPPGGPENSRLLVSKCDSVDRFDCCFRKHVSKAVSRTGFERRFRIPIQ